ncbi:MAG: hypothetical protein ACOYJY_03490 [Acutalibacteraceae bacterium]
MRFAARLCRVGMWITMLAGGFFQWAGIVGIAINNARSDRPYTVWPLAAATVVLMAAVIWFAAAPRHRLPGVIAAGLASIVIGACALDLWQTFEVSAVVVGGLTLGTLIWRHLSVTLAFFFMLAAYLLENTAPAPEREDDGSSTILG